MVSKNTSEIPLKKECINSKVRGKTSSFSMDELIGIFLILYSFYDYNICDYMK